MKTVVFTVMPLKYGIKIKCNSLLVDLEDREIVSVSVVLLSEMCRLSSKYNNRGIAVLFEAG